VSAPLSKKNAAAFVQNLEVKDYCRDAPFDPPQRYPELPFVKRVNPGNSVYPMIRELWLEMGLDLENIGTPAWNPFRGIIRPGAKVLIKPNLVTHHHYLGGDAVLSSIVHGSVLRPIVDYAFLALEGEGIILIADNPLESADFDEILRRTGIGAMVDRLRDDDCRPLKLLDLRPKAFRENAKGDYVEHPLAGDPLGYEIIDLGTESCFAGLDDRDNVYCTLYDKTIDHLDPFTTGKSKTDEFHHKGVHRYVVSKSVLDADVVINVAKLKTHCKAGVTLGLKNAIGIIGNKICMPHHRGGPPPEGDAFPHYPRASYVKGRRAYRKLRQTIQIHRFPGVRNLISWLRKNEILVAREIEHGNWQGNDTLWRTILDVNRIWRYADRDGRMSDTPQRPNLTIIDGIIGQHGDAPMSGTPIVSSIVFGGFDGPATDALAVKAMGIDYRLVKTVVQAGEARRWPLSAEGSLGLSLPDRPLPSLGFRTPKGWSS